jgi:membrane-associated phospholipid phosphatase
MFQVFGYEDTLFSFGSLNHGSGLIELASNPYAAMPSLHAADALIVGITMALIVKSRWAKALWMAWPAWVWFAVMATANHFWLDIAAGVLVALITGAIIYRRQLRRVLGRPLQVA